MCEATSNKFMQCFYYNTHLKFHAVKYLQCLDNKSPSKILSRPYIHYVLASGKVSLSGTSKNGAGFYSKPNVFLNQATGKSLLLFLFNQDLHTEFME